MSLVVLVGQLDRLADGLLRGRGGDVCGGREQTREDDHQHGDDEGDTAEEGVPAEECVETEDTERDGEDEARRQLYRFGDTQRHGEELASGR